MSVSDDRGTLWLATWYPPTDSMDFEISKREIDEYAKQTLPPGWRLKGQMEQCPETKRHHYQFAIWTPQVRCAAVRKQMGNAHIERAKSKAAVKKYVEKEETRVATIEAGPSIPSIFEYQVTIAKRWKEDGFQEYVKQLPRKDYDDIAMLYLDSLVAEDIANGQRGAEWIATNPMWRNAWKKFWRSIIKRENGARQEGSEEGSEASGTPAQLGASEV